MQPASKRHTFRYHARPTTWLGKLAFGAIALSLAVLAFFFLTVALVAGAIVGLALLARLWWLARKLRRERKDAAIEGEYTIVEPRETIHRLDDTRNDPVRTERR